jgi:hypothetical protein
MYIALVNSFPNRPETAEMEFIARFKCAARTLGHVAEEVVTSNDILACCPDFVIALHQYTPKLTGHLTLGAMWNPPAYFHNDPYPIKAILSHDGHLVGSEPVRKWLDDLECSLGIKKPKSDFLFLPTSPLGIDVKPGPARRDLVYTGIHWDGNRHNGVLGLLAASGALNVYGPEKSWAWLRDCYRGKVPFDGKSIFSILERHGIALCFNTKEHRIADTPSMRLFESAAAECVIVSDETPFARRTLGECAFYVDLCESDDVTVNKVLSYLRWVNANPDSAQEMARKSKAALREFSLERMVERCCEFATALKARWGQERFRAVEGLRSNYYAPIRRHWLVRKAETPSLIDVIVRAGDRSLHFVRRALRSIANQDFAACRVILVDYKGREDIEALARLQSSARMPIRYLRSPDTGFRSTSMWTGLRNVEAPFFAVLDDDDEVLPEHFSSLLWLAERRPRHGLYHSGVIRAEEESDCFEAPNFSGVLNLGIAEKRELKFLQECDLQNLATWQIPLTTNSWIARRELLDEDSLIDPELVLSEDPYLYFLLASKADFVCNFRPTAIWNFRSSSQESSMWLPGREALQREVRAMIQTRLWRWRFPSFQRLEDYVSASVNVFPEGDCVPLIHRYFDAFRKSGFNPSEAAGTWTNAERSWVDIQLKEPARRLKISLSFSMPTGSSNFPWVKIEANELELFCGDVPAQQRKYVTGELCFSVPDRTFRLTISCGELVTERAPGWASDRRRLGVLLHELGLQRR